MCVCVCVCVCESRLLFFTDDRLKQSNQFLAINPFSNAQHKGCLTRDASQGMPHKYPSRVRENQQQRPNCGLIQLQRVNLPEKTSTAWRTVQIEVEGQVP